MNSSSNTASANNPIHLYNAAAITDATGLNHAPGSIAIQNSTVVAVGSPKHVLQSLASHPHPPKIIDLPNHLLLPGLVNAHTHLNLTDIGPKPPQKTFIDWIGMVIANRPTNPQTAITQGSTLSTQSGVLTIGDISDIPNPDSSGAIQPSSSQPTTLQFSEFLGLHPQSLQIASQKMTQYINFSNNNPPHILRGLQPHAPYSTSPQLYRQASASNLPLTTHLAETPEELQFVASASGPFRDLLNRLNKWHPSIASDYNQNLHPVDWLAQHVTRPILCAHCNYVEAPQIKTLANLNWSVAYCPRASDYFGHTNHSYRKMLAAGVNVCLGTDSIICHSSLSILDEMRHLYQRDNTSPLTLLKMATTHGLTALSLNPTNATFTPNASPGLISIQLDNPTTTNPLASILNSTAPPKITIHEWPQ